MMQKTLTEIARIIKGEVSGDGNTVITGLKGVQEAQEGDLTFVAHAKYIPLAKKCKASAIIIGRDVDIPGKTVIRTEHPSLAFAQIAALFFKKPSFSFKGVHETAVLSPGVSLGNNVSIGPYVVLEDDVHIGDNTVIGGGGYIFRATRIGKNCILYPHVVVREYTEIGDRVIIHSGTVIGSDGFGYEKIDGRHIKIPQLGIVQIEDDVEIGANAAVDRARTEKTVIGRGTKIDNLVHIGHNVIIGEDCILVAQVGISGSVNIGRGAVFAGQSGVAGHLSIGEGAVVTAQTGVTASIPANIKVTGIPAREYNKEQRIKAHVQRLPQTVERIKDLEARIRQLEEKLGYARDAKDNQA